MLILVQSVIRYVILGKFEMYEPMKAETFDYFPVQYIHDEQSQINFDRIREI